MHRAFEFTVGEVFNSERRAEGMSAVDVYSKAGIRAWGFLNSDRKTDPYPCRSDTDGVEEGQ
jgi:hypothetical protein